MSDHLQRVFELLQQEVVHLQQAVNALLLEFGLHPREVDEHPPEADEHPPEVVE